MCAIWKRTDEYLGASCIAKFLGQDEDLISGIVTYKASTATKLKSFTTDYEGSLESLSSSSSLIPSSASVVECIFRRHADSLRGFDAATVRIKRHGTRFVIHGQQKKEGIFCT